VTPIPTQPTSALSSKRLTTITVLGLALILVVAILSFYSGRAYLRTNAWKDHSDEVLAEISRLHIAFEAAETTQRGYVLTRHEEFQQDFAEALRRGETHFARLRALTVDNPEQQAELTLLGDLLAKKSQILREVLDDVRAGRTSKAIATIRAGNGRILMDQIREKIAEIERNEVALLRQRTEAARNTFTGSSLVTAFGLLLAFFFLATIVYTLRREIVRRAKVEQELSAARAKAMEASDLKSGFLANMSHEIRNPLNGIIGMAKLLSQSPLSSEQANYVTTISESSHALLALINDILDFSKIESGKLQIEETPFQLRSLAESVIKTLEYLAAAKGLQIRLELSDDLPNDFIGDSLRIRQILLNLIGNAVKFSSAGEIKLRILLRESSDSSARVFFEVSDEGAGFDAETKARLFQSFSQGDASTTRKYGGTGLGLAICRQLVTLMRGTIDAESTPGKGSRFHFELPLRVAKYIVFPDAVAPKKGTAPMGEAKILIVEDNLTNQKVAVGMLRLLGCEAKVVENGQAAIDILARESFDLVLMDGHMPEMDGYEATRRIRADLANTSQPVPIIAATANAVQGDREKCLEAGMDDYIAKPIVLEDLRAKVEKWYTHSQILAFDGEVLARMRDLAKDARLDLELVQVFRAEFTAAVERIRECMGRDDWKRVTEEAHSLKSTCANLGLMRLRDTCDRLEKLPSSASLAEGEALLKRIEWEGRLAYAELERYEKSA
jgi:signal transduction histidine kinase/DNA-binding response OmpR family regulator